MNRTKIPAELHPETLLTTEQASVITGISKFTFERWRCRKEGDLPFVRIGNNLVRYRWEDLRLWIVKSTINPSAA